MEQLYGRTKINPTGVFSDPSHRMSQRPLAIKSGEGLGFQDIGSSLNLPKPVTKTYKGKSKAATSTRRTTPRISENESDDELLLSSQNSIGGSKPSPSKRAIKGKKPSTSSDAEETVCVGGRMLTAHPDYKPSSFRAMKGLRFKKSTPTGAADVPPPSSLPSDSQDLFKPISDDVEILPSRQYPNMSSSRHRSPSKTRVTVHSSTDTTQQMQPRPRPRPRVVITSKPPKRDSPEPTPRLAAPKHGPVLRSKTPERPAHAGNKRAVKAPPFPSPLRREPQEFPVSSQAKENVSDTTSSSDVPLAKAKKASTSRVATSTRGPKQIPLPSPFGIEPVSRESTFPNLSPLLKGKGKARARSSEEHDLPLTSDAGMCGGPKPFPMSSDILAGIKPRSNSPNSSKSVKRASSDDSGAEQSRTAKKRKDSISRVLDILEEPVDEDSIDMGYVRDPSKLCPYCDEGLPSHPTPFLQHLLTTARKKSVSDPRPRNRRGLKAPLTIYISVCQRHRFESHQLPIADKRGWPKTIDFTNVPARVKKMKEELEAIILDNDSMNDIEDIAADEGTEGPRKTSVFWKEVMKEVKRQGSRTVAGVKGQYASFEKAQPGYYGEQGSVIIHQSLFNLFPPSTFDASLIAPLAPAEFIQRILVPEAAVRLIVQDLRVSIEDAIVTLRDSAQYGVAMFPDTSDNKRKGTGDDEEMGVADQIVMERARARRKEIAEEEKVEKEMLEEARAAQRAQARESRREKALERAQRARKTKAYVGDRTDTEDASEAPEASTTRTIRGTRRGTKQSVQTDTCGDSESDAMSVDSLASRWSSRIVGKGTRRDESKAPECGIYDHVTQKASKPKNTNSDVLVGLEPAVPRERKKPPSFGKFTSLNSDGEQESTPRPARERTTTSNAPILPLQIARNRPDAGASSLTYDGWAKNLRTNMPDDLGDSDSSHRSQRLDRPRMKKGKHHVNGWLWSGESSCGSPSEPKSP